MTMPHKPLILLLTIIFLQFISSNGVREEIVVPPLKQTIVKINNTLESKVTIQVHCKDKDHDLGIHQIPYYHTYEFGFVTSKFGRSLYFCGFIWNDKLHWFDIYVNSRDVSLCGKRCWWIVKESGPCLLDTPIGEDCFPWNQD